uniref:Phosphate transporter n=1 Tax=Strongyloides stercoralis TaxID=6248 RepID=A0A0K0DUA9_STRER
MKIPTIDETIKRPTTAINQPKVNLNTRLTPLNNQLMYNKLYPEKDNLYNKGSSYQNVLINNRKLTRYSSRRHPSISPEGEGIYPILSLEKVSQQHPYTETSTSLDPVSLNAENLQSNGKHFSINGVKNSTVSLPKSSNTTTKRKITVKRNTLLRIQLKLSINKKN